MSQLVLHAFDQTLMMNVWMILGSITKCMGRYEESWKHFKFVREIAGEREDVRTKMLAYSEMGEAYSLGQQYDSATKCFKKVMVSAWRQNNVKEELMAYQGMAT